MSDGNLAEESRRDKFLPIKQALREKSDDLMKKLAEFLPDDKEAIF